VSEQQFGQLHHRGPICLEDSVRFHLRFLVEKQNHVVIYDAEGLTRSGGAFEVPGILNPCVKFAGDMSAYGARSHRSYE